MARKVHPSFMKKMCPSEKLSAVIGDKPVARSEATKKIWDYIKKHSLQNKKNRRNIDADEKLKPLFGKPQVTMFDLAKILNKNLS